MGAVTIKRVNPIFALRKIGFLTALVNSGSEELCHYSIRSSTQKQTPDPTATEFGSLKNHFRLLVTVSHVFS
jgi:hypothetical protein